MWICYKKLLNEAGHVRGFAWHVCSLEQYSCAAQEYFPEINEFASAGKYINEAKSVSQSVSHLFVTEHQFGLEAGHSGSTT